MNKSDSMDIARQSLELHRELAGKIEVVSRKAIESEADLSLLYTPGVASPCLEIEKDPDQSYALTRRGNLVAVVTDGSAVLGLGDIGPEAAMPVMEGKCVLFKSFAGVDAFPLCVQTQDPEAFVETVVNIAGSFGGINLEDIAAPRCFEIEQLLKDRCDIPIFHDDQHGTAIVTLAGLLNALKVVGKTKEEVAVVISGAGAAGLAIAKLLFSAGFSNVVVCDSKGAIHSGRSDLDAAKMEFAQMTESARLAASQEAGSARLTTNQELAGQAERDVDLSAGAVADMPGELTRTTDSLSDVSEKSARTTGSLSDALEGADVFIGVSVAGLLTTEMVETMAPDSIVFACANPTPEIFPEEALAGGARVVATGRSDFPNQINNVLVFPGVFKGALAVRASDITESMKLRASYALAELVDDERLSAEYIIPSVLDKSVADAVAHAVAAAAREEGVARVE